MTEVNDDQFEILMKTIDKFEDMLAARMAEIKELHKYFQTAAAELELHDKRIKELEKIVNAKHH